jgi:hypothetical protein
VTILAWRSPTDPYDDAPIAVGDVIRTGENLHPHFEVIAMCHDRAWVRDTQYGTDHIVTVAGCSKIC